MKKLFTIVAAAGQGTRLGSDGNKMYLKIGGKPLLARTLGALNACPSCHDVAVAVAPGEEAKAKSMFKEYKADFARLKIIIVAGGDTRQHSVANALKAMPAGYDFVAVHDGARPFIKADVFERVFGVAKEKGAAIAVTQVNDTVKFIRNNLVESTANRDHVVFAQTPQIFLVKILLDAYAKAEQEGVSATDDAGLVENLGWRVSVVPGERENLKITTLLDMFWAEKILEGDK